METRVLSFRMPLGWPELLDSTARQYHFDSRGEMLRLILIEAALNAIKGKLKVKGSIAPPTATLGCRLPVATHRAIGTVCCKRPPDTPSTWAALVVAKWVKDLQKEDSRQQKDNMYWLWLRDYAKNYRDKVSVYNTDRGINEGQYTTKAQASNRGVVNG